MGIFFTLLYIITAYTAPSTFFGDLAEYHIEVIIGVIALLVSLLAPPNAGVLRMTQTWAIAALCLAVACSMIFNGWMGGGAQTFIAFVPDVACFFLIVINFRKKRHLQLLVAVLFLIAVFIVGQAEYALHTGDKESKYLLYQRVSELSSASLTRIRGLSFLSDPNDFCQFIVALIPCMFLFWEKGRSARNLWLVYLPAAFLVFTMYLTHSRGGMVALMAIAVFAGRRRIGTVRAVVIGVVLFAALSAAGFSGGRDVTASEDRLDAWSVGLELIRSHPVFGVGYGEFIDFNEITAHNTFVVCAAELGLFGVYSLLVMLIVTIRDAFVVSVDPNAPKVERIPALPYRMVAEARARPEAAAMSLPASHPLRPAPLFAGGSGNFAFPVGTGGTGRESGGGYPGGYPGGMHLVDEPPTESDAELRRMAALMVLCFVGFLTAGWFLSRAYTMVLYVNAGLAVAVYKLAEARGLAPPRMTAGRALKLGAIAVVVLLTIMYAIVRVHNYLPH